MKKSSEDTTYNRYKFNGP